MPFFSVFNIDDTHESKLWGNKDLPLTVDPAIVPVPPYLPDNKIARNDIARHYSNIEIMDKKVGVLIDELKQAGLYDNTIIFFYSDHGGPLPHQKREIYEYGLKTPLLIKGINQKNSEISNRLISFTDLGPTVLSLANVKPPQDIDGKSFMGKYESKPRKYVYGTSDRFDEFTDRIRTVRTEQYVYIKNYYPNLTKYKDVLYRKSVPLMMNMIELKANNQLNAIQMSWFQTKEKEELYDAKKDPFSLVNLASKPEYKSVLEELRSESSKQFDQKFDFATLAESEMILKMWPNNIQPKTESPNFKMKDKTISLSCVTKGSSLSYIISDSKNEKFDLNSNWVLYAKPIQCTSGKYIYVIANRIGFKDSDITQFQFE
jgi:N-sulfoglucosamine sulfohydrolase